MTIEAIDAIGTSDAAIESPLIRLDQVVQYLDISKSKVYSMMQANEFPHPIRIGIATRWLKAEVEEWLVKQAASR